MIKTVKLATLRTAAVQGSAADHRAAVPAAGPDAVRRAVPVVELGPLRQARPGPGGRGQPGRAGRGGRQDRRRGQSAGRRAAGRPDLRLAVRRRDQAAEGLADGTYYLIDHRSRRTSRRTWSAAPARIRRGRLISCIATTPMGTSSGCSTASVQNQFEAAINRAAIGAYFETVFANLDTIKDGRHHGRRPAPPSSPPARTRRAKGATDLATGITTAKDGSASWSPAWPTPRCSPRNWSPDLRRQGRLGRAGHRPGHAGNRFGRLRPRRSRVAPDLQQLASTWYRC